MQIIQKIAKEALKELMQEGSDPTPEAYTDYFCRQAKKMGLKSYGDYISLKNMLEKKSNENYFTFKSNSTSLFVSVITSESGMYSYGTYL